MSNKLEQVLEYLINEEHDKASDLLHDIVVEKSRAFYEELVDEDSEYELEEMNHWGGDEKEDFASDIESDMDETDMEEEFYDDEDLDDAEEDMLDAEGDLEADMDYDADGELDDHEEDHDELEDKVDDLESALDDLRAEFEDLMGGSEEDMGADMDMDSEADMDMDDEDEMEGMYEATELQTKVKAPSNTEENDHDNAVVAGKNDMGGKADNILGGKDGGGKDAGLTNPKGSKNYAGKDKHNYKKDSEFKKDGRGHGSEKKGSKETADHKDSVLKK